MKNIVILGSTGSIGTQAIEVVLERPHEFKVIGLAAKSDSAAIIEQAAKLAPQYICMVDTDAASALRGEVGRETVVLDGAEGLTHLASIAEADIILNAIVGSAGLTATLAAIEADKILALANKESLVAAGALVNKALLTSKTKILPVDSEHNALFQCLVGEDMAEVSKIILTASGGPFRGLADGELARVTPAQALDHPRWRMGPRITVDSATLMNKGFEVIEAHWLFGLPYEQIDVLIHPQAIVHSLVEFIDGSIKAHLGPTDMKLPILSSLAWPQRLASNLESLDLTQIGALEFFRPDTGRDKCLGLALEAARLGRSYPTALNGADETSVESFLSGGIGYNEIGNIIDAVLERHDPVKIESIAAFSAVDRWARDEAARIIAKIRRR